MKPSLRIAFIGNSLPRRCGIATFTTDLQQAVANSPIGVETTIIAITDPDGHYAYPPSVGFEIRQEHRDDYLRAADFINAGGFDAVSLQHEFGIFGGESGGHILALLERLTVPVVATLHTVLDTPSATQRHIIDTIIARSTRVVVMAQKGCEILIRTHGAPGEKLMVIPHGIPDFAFVEPEDAKQRLGFSGRTVILTFGLLSPNKGIEVMIDAMPAVLAARPDAVYVVLGATHPNLVREKGEAYRESLVARAGALGISENVVFLDQFVDRPALLEYISMCDVYVTPYLSQSQMTSGTLAYSFGLGRAVVSTPYWHAQELLADGRGVLVPFGDAAATGREVAALLNDESWRRAMRMAAYAMSRSMTWEQTARRYVRALGTAPPALTARDATPPHRTVPPTEQRRLPALVLEHLRVMSDDTGLIQHAIHSVPDRSHGYCVDDNARALLLAGALTALDLPGSPRISDRLTATYAAFVQHAFNRDTGRFRNFMSFDRRWLEPQGSEDSHGRTLWALGVTTRDDATSARRDWAAALFAEALPVVESFGSPRAWVFTLLGLTPYCESRPGDAAATQLRLHLADRLVTLLHRVETPEWVWFEAGLAYDNARICEALIASGRATGRADYVEVGLRTLDWLMQRQTGERGLFRPVGSEGFGDLRQPPRHFDQQPVEAAATIAACLEAWRATGSSRWQTGAARAFSWFLGKNDLGIALVDTATGACRDGLHPDRANENRGAESVISYLLSLVDMRHLERIATTRTDTLAPRQRPHLQPLRGRIVPGDVPKPAGILSAS